MILLRNGFFFWFWQDITLVPWTVRLGILAQDPSFELPNEEPFQRLKAWE